jgi:hypothetical protein
MAGVSALIYFFNVLIGYILVIRVRESSYKIHVSDIERKIENDFLSRWVAAGANSHRYGVKKLG